MRAATRSITISRPSQEVFDFISAPQNLPLWSQSLCQSVSQNEYGGWLIHTPDQHQIPLEIRSDIRTGVIDQILSPGPDIQMFIPGRVLSNGYYAEFVLTLFQPDEISEAAYQNEIQTIEFELLTLKGVLETP